MYSLHSSLFSQRCTLYKKSLLYLTQLIASKNEWVPIHMHASVYYSSCNTNERHTFWKLYAVNLFRLLFPILLVYTTTVCCVYVCRCRVYCICLLFAPGFIQVSSLKKLLPCLPFFSCTQFFVLLLYYCIHIYIQYTFCSKFCWEIMGHWIWKGVKTKQ